MTQKETLEEVAERYGKQVLDERKSKNLSVDEEIWLSGGSIVGFIDGAKWQAERMYSEEDMISFAHFYFQKEFNSTMQTSKSTDEIFKEWFEQFKKK